MIEGDIHLSPGGIVLLVCKTPWFRMSVTFDSC